MLEYLEIQNAGPADHLRLDLAPRLNLLTGDNGLGKSFLLDVAWWALTTKWPASVNSEISSGLLVRPRRAQSESIIKSKCADEPEFKDEFMRIRQQWHANYERKVESARLVVYAQVDGSFAILDRFRNIRNSDILTASGYYLLLPFPYVISARQVWDGLEEGQVIFCNGLLRDWASWQKEKGASFELLKKVLASISPDTTETLELSELTRVGDDARDIPTIKMPYGEVPVVHTSAGMRRILSLAYILVWTWQEHLRAAELRGLEPVKQVTLLVDELDAHLHPRWQKTIVRSLMEVMNVLAPEVKVQLIAATHSPLVMASVEPFFDPEQDAWFDLDLNKETGQVEVTKRPWYRRGDADAWLKSEAFDQKSGYAPETEQALEEATAAMRDPSLTEARARELDTKLRGLLGDLDTFWIRWGYLFEDKGWRK